MSITIKGLKEVREYLDEYPEELFEKAKEILKGRVFSAHFNVTLNLTVGSMRSRTGLLRKSIRPIVSGTTLDNLRAGIFAGRYAGGKEVVYAPIHEYGGTIRAKRAYTRLPGGPYLNIPTSSNKTAAGVTRLSARDVFSQGGYIVRMKRSGIFGVFLNGQLMYTLHKEVKIKARLGMHKAMESEIPTLLYQLREMEL